MAKFSGIDFLVCFPLLNPRRVHELALSVKSATIKMVNIWEYVNIGKCSGTKRNRKLLSSCCIINNGNTNLTKNLCRRGKIVQNI